MHIDSRFEGGKGRGNAEQVAGGALRLRAEEGRWRLGVTLTCGPQLTASARGRRGALALVGRVGRKRGGRRGLDGPSAGEKRKGKKKRRKVGWAAGREMGWFFFLFQSFLNLFQTLLNSKLLHLFKFKFLTQISPTILKAFHKPFLTTFQTYFKFKPLHKFSQAISQLFLGTLSQIF
jgi:hypothetical protein